MTEIRLFFVARRKLNNPVFPVLLQEKKKIQLITWMLPHTHLVFINLLIHFKYMDSQFLRPGHFAVK